MALFPYDTLIEENDFCNFKKERLLLEEWVNEGKCIKIFGPRNFGKTSLVRNIVGKNWELKDPEKRLIVFADMFAVESDKDVSAVLAKGFAQALQKKKSWLEKGVQFFSLLKHIRPVWRPPVSTDDFGEFSITSESGSPEVDSETVIENIDQLNRKGKFRCLLILDEFQELSALNMSQAKLRGALQKLSDSTSVAILGSKKHMLQKIFNEPKEPFHNWGNTLELGYIPHDEYTEFANSRFKLVGQKLTPEASVFLQDFFFRIPESMNRACDFISRKVGNKEITLQTIKPILEDFLELSRSIPAAQYLSLSTNERSFLKAITEAGSGETLHSREFLLRTMTLGISKSSLAGLKTRLLDRGVLFEADGEAKPILKFADPLLYHLVRKM
jgi:uncharacterized protein